MAHTTGFSTGPVDLLDKLRIWLLSRGWTTDAYSVDGNGYRLHMHKGSIYLNFRSYVNELPGYYIGQGTGRYGIGFNLGTGYSGASAWSDQAGIPIWLSNGYSMGAAMVLHAGPFTSHQFFDDENGNYLVMVERAPGVWRNLCWGTTLDKSGAGTWTGGQYFSGTASFGLWDSTGDDGGIHANWPPMMNGNSSGGLSFVRADVDTFTNKWLTLAVDSNAVIAGFTGKYACNALKCDWDCAWVEVPIYESVSMGSRLYCVQDERAVLLPMAIYAKRDAGGMSSLGTVPSLAISASGAHGLSIGQDMAVGAETWRQFNGFLVKVI